MKDLLSKLNEQQLAAVKYIEGPIVIFAGAGSGKTRVITYRIAYLLNLGVDPYSIIAVTFTNKAAEEMKTRICDLVGQKAENVLISTFHSFCAKFLYQEAKNINLNKNFLIYDESDSKKVIKDCIKELSLDEQRIPLSYIYEEISRAKDNIIDAESYRINSLISQNPFKETVAEIYLKYQQKLKSYNALDFGDLIMKTIEILKDPQFARIKEKYSERFKFIHVDEYQDVNFAQVVLLKLLSSKHKNICVVGDDDQAIYSWRGSDMNYLLNFKKDFSFENIEVKEFKLEKNYRSKQSILDIGNILISKNKNRVSKILFSEIKGKIEDDIKILRFQNEYEEAKFVAKEIRSLIKEKKTDIINFAVFYRTNAQSRVFEDVFREEDITYKIVGSLSFYDRSEIKDILAYLRIIINPEDNISLKRIINTPSRGIGDTTILYLETLAKEKKTSLWQQLVEIDNTELSLKTKNAVWKFLTLYDILKREKEMLYPSEFIEFLLDKTGYLKMLEENLYFENKIDKIENVKELISLAKNYEIQQNITTLEEFLTKISLTTNIETEKKYYKGNKENIVSLMTLHSAKGLEFDVVFLTGLEEGVLPTRWAIKKENNFYRFLENKITEINYNENICSIEEERRLCYVGITRAKKTIYLTYSEERNVCGVKMRMLASRFLNEILEYYNKKLFKENSELKNIVFKTEDISQNEEFKVGEYVLHEKFGIGKIKEIYKEPTSDKIEVIFYDGKIRKLDLEYANLKKIKGYNKNAKNN